MNKKPNKEAGNGAIIIFFVAAIALTLFLTYFRSLNDSDSVRQRANSASAINNLSINNLNMNDPTNDLEILLQRTQATVAVLIREGDANVGAAILAGRFAGSGVGFENEVVDASRGDRIFLGFRSPDGARASANLNVNIKAPRPDQLPSASGLGGPGSIDTRLQILDDPL